MAGGLASDGETDVWLGSLQHPTHAMPGHCIQRNKIISQFVAPYFAPSTSSPLLCKLDGQPWLVGLLWPLSGLLWTRSLKPFPPEATAPALKFSAFKTDHHFAVLVTTHRLPPYGTRAVPSDWSSTRANILHSPEKDWTSWKSCPGETGITHSSLLSPLFPGEHSYC